MDTTETDTQEQETPTAEQVAVRPKSGFFSLGTLVLLVGLAMVVAVVAMALARQNQTQPTEGPAPDFEFTSFEGETFSLSDFRGNVVVVNFWASWCGECRDEAPALQTTWERFAEQDVTFIGIAYADNGPRSRAYINEFGLTFFNAPDLETRISEKYNVTGVPETFIVDRDGNIAEFIYGPGITVEWLSVTLNRLLAQS